MTIPEAKVENLAISLSETAFATFCEDISATFEVGMEVSRQEIEQSTIKSLKKHFNQVVAVNCVKAEGAMEGMFQLIFDQQGLFALAGVILMLPEKTILEYLKRGTDKDAMSLSDSMGEMGNMLVGCWDRVFREEMEGHGHFTQQLPAFIGKPWSNTREIGLPRDEEIIFVPYSMKVSSYPPFRCGVTFPKSIFPVPPESEEEQEDTPAEPEVQEEQAGTEEAQPAGEVTDTEEASRDEEVEAVEEGEAIDDSEAVEASDAIEGAETVDSTEAEQTAQPEPKDGSEDNAQPEARGEPEAETKSQAEPEVEQLPEHQSQDKPTAAESQPPEPEQTNDNTEPGSGEVAQTIRKMTDSPAELPGESNCLPLAICAREVMDQDVVWANPEDTVEQALTKMQQRDVGYMLVGSGGVAEGIISKSDISGATSPYLRPIFAKWRRPLDDATLQIRIKWIMIRPVHTIRGEASLSAVMENMSRLGGRCVPVADGQGRIEGLITVFDIFKVLLNNNSFGRTPQAPQLV